MLNLRARVISSGDVQWMTAGSGIIHQEMPQGNADGVMHGFQLWANLPAKDKLMAPRYRGISSNQIPTVTLADGATIKVIAGTVDGTTGPVTDIVIDPQYLDCTLLPGATHAHATEYGYTTFIYVIDGQGEVNGTLADNGTLVLFGKGEQAGIHTDEGIRYLFLSGQPLDEPVAWQGPIVMNTQAELDLAFHEYRQGTFIKDKV